MGDFMKKPRKDSYKEAEINLLKEIFENNTKAFIIAKFQEASFNRSWQSLNVTARSLGIRRNPEIIKQEMIAAGSAAINPDVWTPEEDAILKEFYPISSRETLLAKLPQRTFRGIRDHALQLGLSRTKEAINKDRTKHLFENHGITSPFQLKSTQEKSRQTNMEKRGVPYAIQHPDVREEARKTVQEKYGVDNVFQAKEIIERIKKTNLKNLGVENPQQNPEIKKDTENTNIERYGVKNPFQLIDRVKKGMIEKYGADSPLKVPEIQERQQQTNVERYGFPIPTQNPDIQAKIENTNIEKYGYKTPFLHPMIKQLIRETNLKKYGVTNPAQVEEIKKRIGDTTFERHGVRSFLEIKEVREKAYRVRKGRKSIHKSKEEIEFLEYLKIFDLETQPHIENPATKNIIDFYMPRFDLWVQYDGAYWHGKIKRLNVTRQSLKIQRTIKRDRYQNNLIPNLIRFWSDDVQLAIKNETILKLIEDKIIEKTCFSHQYLKKMETIQEDLKQLNFDPNQISASDFILSKENINQEITEFILRYEWLGTIGVMPKWCFTARYQGILGGVVFINEPTAYSKLLGEQTYKFEALIQRGASISWAPKNLGSRLVMFSCHWMVENTEKRLFVGYADPTANEIGTIYQACNFDYLGNNFGVSYLFKHPSMKQGKWFSAQILKRTSSFKKWCNQAGIIPQKFWFKENGFKDIKSIPENIRIKWYEWNRKILKESQKIKVDKKHKYALLVCKNKSEENFLFPLKNYTTLPYPKRIN